MRKRTALLGILATLAGVGPGTAYGQAAPAPGRPLTIGRTVAHEITSRIDGLEYRLWVAVPPSYAAAPSSRYPVLFLLDGPTSFPAATISYRISHSRADSLIMVGVGFVDPADGMTRRIAFTLPPTPRSDSNTARWVRRNECCGAAVTARVFREELIPFIDSAYRTTGDRGVLGHSHGGLFATYLLFADPDLFQRYGISSPALWWDNSAIFDHEATFAKTHTALPKDVVIAVGALENPVMVQAAHRLAATLRARDYRGLSVTMEELQGAVHGSMVTWTRMVNLLYPIRNSTALPGDPADIVPARHVVESFLDAYRQRDVEGLRPLLAADSGFQAIIAGKVIVGSEPYLSQLAEEFQIGRIPSTVDTLRVASDDPGQATAIASFTRFATPAPPGGATRGQLMFELFERPEGWRITHVLHTAPLSDVLTTVQVRGEGGPIAGAEVTATSDAGEIASGRTDGSGYAHLPYDWRVSRSRGYLRIEAPGYAASVVPLPTQDSVAVSLRVSIPSASVDLANYVGTFADTSGGRTRIVRLSQDRERLIIEGLPGLRWAVAEFLSSTRIALRDGSEVDLILDSRGVVLELLRENSRFVRR